MAQLVHSVDQIEEMTITNYKADYLLEPVGRNTAPAIALTSTSSSSSESLLSYLNSVQQIGVFYRYQVLL